MEKVSIIGLDLAKRRFQMHGARADGGVAFRKTLSRDRSPRFSVAAEGVGLEDAAPVRQMTLRMLATAIPRGVEQLSIYTRT